MEEVQSWWEVPAVAHFCYVFRSAFNLFFFEIAELESALLNIQDPDMSISVDQLVVRLLQGCYDKESVNYDNWEEKLHELFNDNFEEEENPLGESYFPHLSPRSKIEALLKLCELRLDVEGALDDIKNIPSEDMQAKCIGKDSQNNTYWYFCNERLYREASFSEKIMTQPVKSVKKDSNKISRQSAREKKSTANPNNRKSWTIACFTISDWKQMSNSLSRSKKSQDKELSAAVKQYLPLLEERVAEKDRFLRKRFLELIPKRASSRISKVQEKKKLEEVKAAEEAKRAELKAEKERARKEALLLKQMKESRQKRAEERSKAVEERAERAKLRKLIRVEDTDSSKEEENDRSSANKVSSVKSQKKKDSRNQFNKRKVKEKSDNEFDKCLKNNYLKIRKKDETPKSNALATQPNDRRCIRTYSSISRQSENGAISGDEPVKVNPQKHALNSCESRAAISINGEQSPKLHCASQNSKKVCSNDEYNNKNSCTSDSSNSINVDTKSSNCTKIKDSSSKPNASNLSNCSFPQAINTPLPPRISIYKPNVLSNTTDMTKWNTAFDSRQKVHILYKSSDNLAPKRIKLEQVNFSTLPANVKSSLTKETHLYKPVQFITYGKIIPSSALVKLDYKKPPNQQLSS